LGQCIDQKGAEGFGGSEITASWEPPFGTTGKFGLSFKEGGNSITSKNGTRNMYDLPTDRLNRITWGARKSQIIFASPQNEDS